MSCRPFRPADSWRTVPERRPHFRLPPSSRQPQNRHRQKMSHRDTEKTSRGENFKKEFFSLCFLCVLCGYPLRGRAARAPTSLPLFQCPRSGFHSFQCCLSPFCPPSSPRLRSSVSSAFSPIPPAFLPPSRASRPQKCGKPHLRIQRCGFQPRPETVAFPPYGNWNTSPMNRSRNFVS